MASKEAKYLASYSNRVEIKDALHMGTLPDRGPLKYIKLSNLADRIGMNYSLLRQYAKGIKTPSPKQARRINNGIKELAEELLNFRIL